jgi:hypothetical protein
MALSFIAYTATSGQTEFTFNFPVLSADHVKVQVNGSDITTYTVSLSPTQKVTLNSGATAGAIVKVYRLTPGRSDAPNNLNLVDFVNGSVLSESDLDKSNKQLLYLIQEAQDTGGGALPYDSTIGSWNANNAGNKKISNVDTPVASADAATKGYVDAKFASDAMVLSGGQWDGESKKIQNVTDPSSAQDAATKNYVDTQITTTRDASNLTSGTLPAARLPTSGVTASTYGDSTTPLTQVTVDSTGRVTAASERAIVAGDLPSHTHTASQITDFNTTVDGRIDTKIAANALALSGGNWDAESLRITNVAPPVLGTDAVNLNAISNLALYGNAAAQVPQSWNLTALAGSWTQNGAAGGVPIWEQTLTLSPAAVGTDPNLFVVTVGGVLQFPTTAYRIPSPSQIIVSATQTNAPASNLEVLVRNFGVSRAITSNATTSTPGVITVGTNLNVDGSGVLSVPTATSSVLGVVKPGTGLTVDGNGALNATVIGDASTSSKGIMQVGTGLTVSSGTVSVNPSSNITTATFSNSGLKIRDTDASHSLILAPGSNLTADRTLSLATSDASRTLTLLGDLNVTGAATVIGTNTGDQTITLTGDVTGTGSGSFSTTIANNAVTSAKIAAGAVDSSQIASNAVTTVKILDGAVTSGKIADGTIVNADVNASAAIDLSKLANIATSTVLGRTSAAAGAIEQLALSAFALTAGGSNAAFSNPPTLGTAVSSFNAASQMVNKDYVDNGSYKTVTVASPVTFTSTNNGGSLSDTIDITGLQIGRWFVKEYANPAGTMTNNIGADFAATERALFIAFGGQANDFKFNIGYFTGDSSFFYTSYYGLMMSIGSTITRQGQLNVSSQASSTPLMIQIFNSGGLLSKAWVLILRLS